MADDFKHHSLSKRVYVPSLKWQPTYPARGSLLTTAIKIRGCPHAVAEVGLGLEKKRTTA